MEVHITPLITDIAVSPKCKCRIVGPSPINLMVSDFEDLTISVVACKGLALITLARIF